MCNIIVVTNVIFKFNKVINIVKVKLYKIMLIYWYTYTKIKIIFNNITDVTEQYIIIKLLLHINYINY